MKQTAVIVLGAMLMAGVPLRSWAAEAGLADLPDPLVGTDSKPELSRGNTSPAVFRPFGMLNWTAQTGEGGWPYQYSKDRLMGFLATHRPSAWMNDWGPFSFMPVSGELKVLPSERAAAFVHSKEDARAYRYTVTFDNGIRAEVTPVSHGGLLRFTFPKTGKAYIVLDGNDNGSAVKIDVAGRTSTGFNSSIGWGLSPKFAQHFIAVADQKIVSSGTWDIGGERDAAAERTGKRVGAYLEFAPGSTVTVRVAVSLISPEQARLNLDREIGAKSFDEIVAQARAEWNRELGRITISGGTADQRRTFYTSLYRAFQTPRPMHETDASGAVVHYNADNGDVRPGVMYTDNGLWDTFRAQFPLLALVAPSRDADIIRGMLNFYDETGWLPKWPNPGHTNVMIGTHAESVIADAYAKGIWDFNVGKAFEAMKKDGTTPSNARYRARPGIEEYRRIGYVPVENGSESAAQTLEYAYDDFCIAEMARALGKKEDAADFAKQAQNYRNLYDPTTGYMRGRMRDGSWVAPFDPLAWGGPYTEGNAWQWLWSVQHDVPGLMQLMGGREAFLRRLDELFTTTNEFKVGGYGQVIHEMTEAKLADTGQYAHINEPVHHVIYLYDYAGQPWKAQKWTRTIMDRFYKAGPAGWLGDEDTGQMSSWFVFGAMGFYPTNPGQPVYALSSPLFDRVSIHQENGKTFTVEAQRKNASDVYVQSATLNGKPLDRVWITHKEIAGGGVLQFKLGPAPNEKWGTSGMPVAGK